MSLSLTKVTVRLLVISAVVLIRGTLDNRDTMSCTQPMSTRASVEGNEGHRLGDTGRKSSLVQGELANLQAMRKKGSKPSAIHHRSHVCWDDFQYSLKLVRQNPRILIISFIVFAVLCGGGLCLVFYLAKDEDEQDQDMALDLAVETGRWFCT